MMHAATTYAQQLLGNATIYGACYPAARPSARPSSWLRAAIVLQAEQRHDKNTNYGARYPVAA